MTAPLVAALTLALLGVPLIAAAGPRLRLEVDAREAPRRLLHARLTIPVNPGPLTLVYPKWLPGTHGLTGPILAPGMQVRAVNGRRRSPTPLRDAIAAAQPAGQASPAAGSGAGGPIALRIENGDRFETVNLRYAGGLREPGLERLPTGPDRLGASIASRAP